MLPLMDRLARRLERARELPPSALVRRGVGFLLSRLAGPLLLRNCTRVGARPRVAGLPRITNRGAVNIGDDVIISSVLGLVEIEVERGGCVDIGNDVFVNFGTSIRAASRVSIESNVGIGPYSLVSNHQVGAPGVPPSPVRIDSGAWLGARVTVLPGAWIGAGATIAAGSVVSGRIPAGAVAAGSPARVLRLAAEPGPTAQVKAGT